MNRINEIKEKAVSESFPDFKRALLRDRLEEMAYVFYKEGERSCAGICLTAASSLEDTSSLLGANPFLMALLDRTLDGIQNDRRMGDEAPPLHTDSTSIIVP